MAVGGSEDEAPPPGTAIVRSAGHVGAVREQPAREAADRGWAPELAWAWALGETDIAPVSGRRGMVPPRLADVRAEITEADDRQECGDAEDRADAAAIVLRWLIGEDDHLPIRERNRGDLVGARGGIVRSLSQMADLGAAAVASRQHAVERSCDLDADADSRLAGQMATAYLDGVIATLAWASDPAAPAPTARAPSADLTTRTLKAERLRARDVVDQAVRPWMADRVPASSYGDGVQAAIDWLLGDSTATPIDRA